MNTSLFLLGAIFVVTEAGVVFPGWMQRRTVSCDSNSMRRCLAPLEQFQNFFTNLHLNAVETSEALDNACSHLHTARDCVVNLHETCDRLNRYTQVMSETLEGVANHMCSEEGRDVLLTETECWENGDVENVVEGCYRENHGPYDKACEMVSGMRTCARDTVRSLCNERAANFVDGLIYYLLEPMASEMFDCDMQLRVSRSIMELLSPTHKKK